MIEAVNSETIVRAGKGDSSALTRLYEQCRPGLYRFLYYRVGDPQAAEDLTSEVFLRMLRALERYRPQGIAFEAWLYQIARNLAIDYQRSLRSRNHLPLEEALLSGNEGVDHVVERRLNSQVLVNALGKLGDEQRDVVVLRFVSGLSTAQVAQALHKTEDSVKALQRRGLSALRELLKSWEEEDVQD